MVANVLAFHLDNGSQQAGFHCLLSASKLARLARTHLEIAAVSLLEPRTRNETCLRSTAPKTCERISCTSALCWLCHLLSIHYTIHTYIHLYKNTVAASVLASPSRLWEPAHWLSHSTMMAASVLAHTHFNYDGSQRAGFAIWTMAASVLAYPLQL